MPRFSHLLSVSTLCVATSASAHPKLLRHADAVPDEYIVVLEDHASATATTDRLAAAHGAEVGHRYTAALRGFSARMTDAQAEALANDPAVAYVEQNTVVHGSAVQTSPTWGLDRIDQPALPLDQRYLQLGDGAGVTVYVIDSGLRMTHVELAGRVPDSAYVTSLGSADDCNGHGTHVAATIAGRTWGVAKAAKIVPVRVLDCNNSGLASDVIMGIDWVAQHHAPLAIANLSVGGAPLAAEDQAVRNLIASGVTTVIAAGNANGDACNVTPARVPEAITVGAIANTDARASFSNWGSCVDVFAPGVTIASAGIASDTAINVLDGTSMAAPHVAGVAAAFLGANPGATPALVTTAILDGATRDMVTDTKGSPNRLLNARVVDTVAPSLKILAPHAGDHVETSFRVAIEATDPNLVGVALGVDGRVVGTLASGPFTFDVSDLGAGAHTLTVTSADAGGLTNVQTINVTVIDPTADDQAAELSGGCSTSGGAAALPLSLALLVLLARRRRKTGLGVIACGALLAACLVGDEEEPPVATTNWVSPPCADPIVDANQDGIPDGLDLDCDGIVDIDLTGGGNGSGGGGGGGGGSVSQCQSTINEKSISCTRIDNQPSQCECRVNDQLVRTCTTSSNSACSFPGPDNCCGF